MASYKIIWLDSVRKELRTIPNQFVRRIVEKAEALGENPRPHNSKKLKGKSNDAYCVRVSDYRIIYTIDDQLKTIEINGVRDRKDIYRNL